jgi:L-ascorbate metabolism protein UlaG (beta-lactamase superfamily)
MEKGKTGQELIDDVNATEVSHGQCAYWWLGQHGFILKLGKAVFYIDAYLSPSDARTVAPLLAPENVTNATAIIGTHDHGDHIDRPMWPAMAAASPNAIFVTPLAVRDDVAAELGLPLERIVGLNDGLSATIDGVKITAVPAAHELLSVDPDSGHHDFLGLIMEGNGICVYHAGDTCIYEGMQQILRQWKIDLAFLPINGRDAVRLKSGCIGNMTYQEAVDLAGSIQPGMTVPTHFEMFKMNSENPQLFIDYIEVKYPHLEAQIPVHGVATLVSALA